MCILKLYISTIQGKNKKNKTKIMIQLYKTSTFIQASYFILFLANFNNAYRKAIEVRECLNIFIMIFFECTVIVILLFKKRTICVRAILFFSQKENSQSKKEKNFSPKKFLIITITLSKGYTC